MSLAVVFYDAASGEHWRVPPDSTGAEVASATIGKSTVSIWRSGKQQIVARRAPGAGHWRLRNLGRQFSDVLVTTGDATTPAAALRAASLAR